VRMTLTKIKDVGQDVEKSELLNTIWMSNSTITKKNIKSTLKN
jgi:hypothetical protein